MHEEFLACITRKLSNMQVNIQYSIQVIIQLCSMVFAHLFQSTGRRQSQSQVGEHFSHEAPSEDLGLPVSICS